MNYYPRTDPPMPSPPRGYSGDVYGSSGSLMGRIRLSWCGTYHVFEAHPNHAGFGKHSAEFVLKVLRDADALLK